MSEFKKVYPPKSEPASGLMARQGLTDGCTISHKYKRRVTGEIKVMRGDFYVKWSDGDGGFEVLHSGDVGSID